MAAQPQFYSQRIKATTNYHQSCRPQDKNRQPSASTLTSYFHHKIDQVLARSISHLLWPVDLSNNSLSSTNIKAQWFPIHLAAGQVWQVPLPTTQDSTWAQRTPAPRRKPYSHRHRQLLNWPANSLKSPLSRSRQLLWIKQTIVTHKQCCTHTRLSKLKPNSSNQFWSSRWSSKQISNVRLIRAVKATHR